jgi:signal transduction histidine kinase
LGLSIAYGIVQDHRGTISVLNRPGQGATFQLQFPLAKLNTSEGTDA